LNPARIFAFIRSVSVAFALVLALGAAPQAPAQSLVPGGTAQAETPAPDGSLEALLDVLRDEAARSALIERLEALSGGVPTAAEAEPAAASSPADEAADVARGLAEATARLAEAVVSLAGRTVSDFGRLRFLFSRLDAERAAEVRAEAVALGLTVLASIAALAVLLGIVRRLFAPAPGATGGGTHASLASAALQAAGRAVALVLAWAVGLALAYVVFGRAGIAPVQTLYLNAFLLAAGFGLALRLLVSGDPRDRTLSELPLEIQSVLRRWILAPVNVAIYGVFAAAPIVQIWSGFVAARSVRAIAATLAFALAVAAILRIRATLLRHAEARAAAEAEAERSRPATEPPGDIVAADGAAPALAFARPDEPGMQEPEREEGPAPEGPGEHAAQPEGEGAATAVVARRTLGFWSALWPWLAGAYALSAYLIALTRPRDMGELIARGTLYSAAALLAVLVALRLVSRAGRLGFPRSRLDRFLPGFAPRLDKFAAPVAYICALVLFVLAAALLLEGWQLGPAAGWVAGPALTEWFWRLLRASLIVAALIVLWAAMAALIDERLHRELEGVAASARRRTLLSLFRNAFTVALVVFGTMIALAEIGINIAPLLAGAGVLGLAIGFGAQKLVQDIITGVFIQLENAINEGDVVSVGGITGVVEVLTIRSVSLRDLGGVFHIIPFSAVDTVSNYTKHFAFHVAEVGAAYHETVPDVKSAMEEAFARLQRDPLYAPDILEPLEMHGVTALADSAVVVRARIKTVAGKQWGIGRAYTELVKQVMDERGLEIPFPHRELKLPHELIEAIASRAQRGEPAALGPKEQAGQGETIEGESEEARPEDGGTTAPGKGRG
jgi:small conductance mechanosensitive channel